MPDDLFDDLMPLEGEELDAGIAELRAALAESGEVEDRAELNAALAADLLDRHRMYGAPGDRSDLEEAIACLSVALTAGLVDHPDRSYWAVLLGAAYGLRYELTADPCDRDAGISHLAEGLGDLEADDDELAMFHAIHGNLRWDRVQTGAGSDADLDAAIHSFVEVLAVAGTGDPLARLELQVTLGLAHAARHEREGSRQDLDGAIAAFSASVDDPDMAGSELQPLLALDLGRLLWVRASLDSRRGEREAALAYLRRGVDTLPENHPDRARALLLLGGACVERGVDVERQQWHGDPTDLNTIIACFTEVLPVLPEEMIPRAQVVAALGFALFQRALLDPARRSQDLEVAYAYLEEAADTLTDLGGQLPALRTVGASIVDHCRRGFDPHAIRFAVKLLTRVLEHLPPHDPARAEVAAELGLAMVFAFDVGQLPAGLDQAVQVLEQALAATPRDHPEVGRVHAALGAALVRQSAENPQRTAIGRGIAHLEHALDLLPAGHPQRPIASLHLATALYIRFMHRNQVSDLDVAHQHQQACEEQLDGNNPNWWTARSCLATILFARANYRQDVKEANKAVEIFQECMDALPPSDPLAAGLGQGLGMALLLRGQLRDSDEDRRAGGRWLATAAERLPPDAPLRRVAMATGGLAEALNPSPEAFAAGIERLRRSLASPVGDLEEAMNLAALGGMLLGRHLSKSGQATWGTLLRGNVDVGLADLDEAIQWLDAAAARVEEPAATPWWPLASMQLCMALRRRAVLDPADRPRSREVGLQGLRGFGWRVLLQAGTEDAMAAAREAAAQALEVAWWCLDDNALEHAVEAVEAGRGLVLHAATASSSIGRQLRDAGHSQLAAEWEAALASAPEQEPVFTTGLSTQPDRLAGVPSDLRYRVLHALEGTAATGDGSRFGALPRAARARLLVPPNTDEIRAALRTMGADALVYLVPRSELADEAGTGGRALVIPARGPMAQRNLPLLDIGPGSRLDDYVAASSDRHQSSDAKERWRRSLDALCDWAWPAAVGPLLQQATAWRLRRPPRLVLVPVGLLALVPWHAARAPRKDGTPRYAVEQAAFSYAASARLLCEVSTRTVQARNGTALIVGDPTRTLGHAVQEALALFSVYYGQGVYLGEPSDVAHDLGTPGLVLRHMFGTTPEPAVQHLACHAFIEESPARTYFWLANEQRLTVEDLLQEARKTRSRAGGATVTLAACTTNRTGRLHDESLTLATAFLVAGAASVVGSLWEAPDRRTSLLMFMLHHYLNEDGLPCGDALRHAQLWMLDPAREVPDSMPPLLADVVRTHDLRAPRAWACFSHQGW